MLEIGCGTGVVLRSLLQDSGFSGSATGADQSDVFLQKAWSHRRTCSHLCTTLYNQFF